VTGEGQLRVLMACDFFLRYSSGVVGGLVQAGADVTLLSRNHGIEFGGDNGEATAFVAHAAAGARFVTIGGRVRSVRGAGEAIEMRRRLHRWSPDVVHVQESISNDIRLLLAARPRLRRFALTIHDPVRHPGDAVSRSSDLGNRVLVRTAGLIFVHGEALRDELIDVARPKAPIVVIPHGIDAAPVTEPPEQPALLFFGRISYYKGLDVLLDAMPAIWSRYPETRLTVAGEGDVEAHPALSDVRVEVRNEHVPDADLPALMERANCIVLPYRQASQSGVGALAKAHGRPIVATDVGGLPELVADGSGEVVPAEDPERLAGALVALLADRERQRTMGRAGWEAARRESGWEAVGAETLAAYREYLPVRRS
jgi:glycosyltransferase involved in cell wall biosynthesis